MSGAGKQMTNEHITEILDNASIASLTEIELKEIQAHARDCVSCRGAYEAARLSAVVLRSRAQATIEPSPFFQTRVMAALREQQAMESVPAMLRLWRSSKALVASMAVTTAALAALSFLVPTPVTSIVDQTASVYSAESVLMGQGSDDQMTYEQVLSTIYADDDEAK
jgi:signal transduction histidine kinase